MANDHPFQLLFESFGRLPASHADTVNRGAYDELLAALDMETEKEGRCILLRAPRAGHGKTHLLSRAQHQLGGSHEFIPLHPSGSRVSALSVTEDALNRLTRALPAAGGLTVLDLVIRRLFAHALQPLVISGEVPCQDREGALSALRNRPVETFDFHHPNAVTAHWARENFEVLGPRLSMELAQRCGLPVREVSFWVNAFFRYAATPVDHPGRAGVLAMEVAGEAVTEGIAMERLSCLLALVSVLMRVVLVADDLEGFSADETAALAFAAFITAVRHHAERVDVIISLNEDVWENAFKPRLSGGLADRLSEVLIELEPLSDEDVIALLDSRAPGLGKQVFERVDPTERHARGLIRAAGDAWMKAVREKADAAPAPTSFAEFAAEWEQEADEVAEVAPTSDDEAGFAAGSEEYPASSFTPVFDEDGESSGVATEGEQQQSFPAPAPQWGGGSVYDAQVLGESARTEPFTEGPIPDFLTASGFSFQPAALGKPKEVAASFSPEQAPAFQVASPYFQPVAPDEPVPPPAIGETPVFEPVFEPVASAAAGFGPPPPPQQAPVQPAADDEDRVDDLLKQFRERYGR